MFIKSEFEIEFTLPSKTAIVTLLQVHPSLVPQLCSANELLVESLGIPNPPNTVIPSTSYVDSFGNLCARFIAPPGHLRLSGSNVVKGSSIPDPEFPDAERVNVEEVPSDALRFLLPSRYCEVDRFGAIAHNQFGSMEKGWKLVTTIRDWVHDSIRFDYNTARPTKSSTDVFIERVGVCRDFQHLAITLTRCMNIPARYATGYLGDIRHPYSGPGDFSAWYQVYLGGKWIDLDARHNRPRYGRVLIATGRDAADVAITTSFGIANLVKFYVESNEVNDAGDRVALPEHDSQDPTLRRALAQTNAGTPSPGQAQSGNS